MRRIRICFAVFLWIVPAALAQDSVKVDPGHFKVVLENAEVRVVRVQFGAHYKEPAATAVPARVVVCLTDEHVKLTFPSGKSIVRNFKAGSARWVGSERSVAENLGDKPFDLVWVIPKARPTAVKPGGPDPVKVDPKHYSVVSENAEVRVLRIRYGPHEKSVMHHHPDGVAVFLTATRSRFTFPNGKSVVRSWKAGDARWTPAETHLPQNLTDKPLELILVELKARPHATPGAGGPDPVKVDPKHYSVVLENSRVRVLRIRYGPHEKSVMHYHPDSVGVDLTNEDVKFMLPGGRVEENHRKPGDVTWAVRGEHLPENLADQPFEVVLVELKSTPARAGHRAGKPSS